MSDRFFAATEQDRQTFQQTGCLLVRSLFHADEAAVLNDVARRDQQMEQAATSRADAAGGRTVLAVRDDLSDDLFSTISRCQRVAGNAAFLLGEEVYHYHHKLMLKEPRVGGAWEWHQDYGYWYNYGCLAPDMISCYIAIDRATQANGCLQIIPGSHHLGRLDHGKVGGQTGADEKRVNAILQRMPLEYAEMQPGDALFFHANVLHRSDQNTSEDPRWSFIVCFNARSNSPYELIRHNAYSPLKIAADESIMEDFS